MSQTSDDRLSRDVAHTLISLRFAINVRLKLNFSLLPPYEIK